MVKFGDLVAWLHDAILIFFYFYTNFTYMYTIIIHSLSELPECQVSIAARADIIDQALAVALHPLCECRTAMISVNVILNLTQCPEVHGSIIRKEIVEKMLEIQKVFFKRSARTPSEERMEISVLK